MQEHQVKAHTIVDTVVYWGTGGVILGWVVGLTPYLVFISLLVTITLGCYNIYIKAHTRCKIKKHRKEIEGLALTNEQILSREQMKNITADGKHEYKPLNKKK